MSAAQPTQDAGPLKLLSLDGGGIRGLSSLIILKYLMKRVNPQNPPKPCDYFDLIGGTSTGGIIAIMLGRFKMTVDECISKYLELSSEAFQPKRTKINIFGKAKDTWKTDGSYRADRLASEFKAVAKTLEGDENAKLMHSDTSCRVFVCAFTKALNTPVQLRSYVTDDSVDTLAGSDCAIWQAARATSAAATFFDPIQIGRQKFVDGATGYNNPVEVVFEEALSIWPDAISQIQCLVSIGTGVEDLQDFGDNLKEVIETLKSIATETEKTEQRFFKNQNVFGIGERYFRFNVDKGMKGIGLDEYQKLDKIEAGSESYIVDPRVKDTVQKFITAQPPIHTSVPDHDKNMYLEWLPYLDPLEFHNVARTYRTTSTTGQWFLGGEFEQFRRQKRSLMWLSAKAGAGKTVLVSTVIDEIEEKKLGNLAYCYFSYRSKDQKGLWQDPRHLKYSILIQLARCFIRKDPNRSDYYFIPLALQKLYRDYYPSRNPKDEDINKTILRLLNDARETYIVIDALDENSYPKEVVSFLDYLCTNALTGVHILISSRWEEEIQLAIGEVSAPVRTVPFETAKVNDDIRNHLQVCMGRHPYSKWKDDLKEKVVTYLSEQAGGVFRWADLQAQELGKKARQKDVEKALKKLPKTLEETYERILKQIDEEYAEEAHAILQWLAYSCQPLSLEQAAEIAAFDMGTDDSSDADDYTVSFSPENRFDSPSWVRRILSGLVIVTGVDDERSTPDEDLAWEEYKNIQQEFGDVLEEDDGENPVSASFRLSEPVGHIVFAHFSVKEYLEGSSVSPPKFQLVEPRGQWYIFQSSLAYLQYYDSTCFSELNIDVQPLLIYAWLNWAYHASFCLKDMGNEEIDALLSKLVDMSGTSVLLSASAISSGALWYLRDQAPENFEINSNLHHILLQRLQSSEYKKYFEHKPSSNYTGMVRAVNVMNLWDACYAGRNKQVKVLLDGGLDINMIKYDSPGKHMRRGWTPLHSAAEGGDEEAVRLLLAKGAKVDPEFLVSDSMIDYTSLHRLAQLYGHKELAKHFPDRSIAGRSAREQSRGITPLVVATAAGNTKVALLLVEAGADPNICKLSEYGELSQHNGLLSRKYVDGQYSSRNSEWHREEYEDEEEEDDDDDDDGDDAVSEYNSRDAHGSLERSAEAAEGSGSSSSQNVLTAKKKGWGRLSHYLRGAGSKAVR